MVCFSCVTVNACIKLFFAAAAATPTPTPTTTTTNNNNNNNNNNRCAETHQRV
jgi:hypothetical protein